MEAPLASSQVKNHVLDAAFIIPAMVMALASPAHPENSPGLYGMRRGLVRCGLDRGLYKRGFRKVAAEDSFDHF